MSSSNQTYKDLSLPYFKEVFNIIDDVLRDLEVPYYLIGVTALALSLLKEGIKPPRGTKDIDFAIMISSHDEFEQVILSLERQGFERKQEPWRLFHPKFDTVIDLLPFGKVEESFTVNFNARQTDLHVLGFKEVLEESVEIKIEDKLAQVPSLCGMIILKLVAWSDRPERRENDLKDILFIIKKYFDIASDDIVTNHSDVYENMEPFDRVLIASQVLGREAAVILMKSPALSDRIFSLLNANSFDVKDSPIALKWSQENDWSIEYSAEVLKHFKLGLTENLFPD